MFRSRRCALSDRAYQMDLAHIATCQDLTEDDFALASASREDAYELLNHASVICEPHSGEERVLLFLARCAVQDWIEGDLRVEVRLEGMFECHLVLLCGLGGDAFEVMKRVFLSASFLSFKQLGETPNELLPLELTHGDNQRLVFDATAFARQSSVPPESFRVAQRRLDEKMSHSPTAEAELEELTPDHDLPENQAAYEPPRSSFEPEELPLVQPSPDARPSLSVARIKLNRVCVPRRSLVVEESVPADPRSEPMDTPMPAPTQLPTIVLPPGSDPPPPASATGESSTAPYKPDPDLDLGDDW